MGPRNEVHGRQEFLVTSYRSIFNAEHDGTDASRPAPKVNVTDRLTDHTVSQMALILKEAESLETYRVAPKDIAARRMARRMSKGQLEGRLVFPQRLLFYGYLSCRRRLSLVLSNYLLFGFICRGVAMIVPPVDRTFECLSGFSVQWDQRQDQVFVV